MPYSTVTTLVIPESAEENPGHLHLLWPVQHLPLMAAELNLSPTAGFC